MPDQEDAEKDAFADLQAALENGEKVEALVFGEWGGYRYDGPIPKNKIGKVLTLRQARPLMRGWSFDGGFGCAHTYPVHIWTDRRVLFVHEYDGSSCLHAVPRFPTSDALPEMSGSDPNPRRF